MRLKRIMAVAAVAALAFGMAACAKGAINENGNF